MTDSAIDLKLDLEISSLQSQILSLKTQRSFYASTILSSRGSLSTLSRLRARTQSSAQAAEETNPLISTIEAQQAHIQTNLYRLCATITSFTVKDPDPNAVNNGHVFALRFDVSNGGTFIRPYYVMLNKPFLGDQKQLLRVHRHTLPPAIPISILSKKYLPNGKAALAMGTPAIQGAKKQSLPLFARALRHAIVAYHNRVSAIKNMRRDFRLDEKASRKGKSIENVIADISAVDAEARQVRVEWVDGRIGRALVGEGGEVEKCVIISEDGRDREMEKRVVGSAVWNIVDRLKEGTY